MLVGIMIGFWKWSRTWRMQSEMNNSKEGIDQVELESEKRKIDEREKQSFKERFRLSEN